MIRTSNYDNFKDSIYKRLNILSGGEKVRLKLFFIFVYLAKIECTLVKKLSKLIFSALTFSYLCPRKMNKYGKSAVGRTIEAENIG